MHKDWEFLHFITEISTLMASSTHIIQPSFNKWGVSELAWDAESKTVETLEIWMTFTSKVMLLYVKLGCF